MMCNSADDTVAELPMKSLSTAQRFWILASSALLATTIAIIFLQWPLADKAVIADLRADDHGKSHVP